MTTKRQKFLLILFGLIVVPLLFELCLCAAGSLFHSFRIKNNSQSLSDKNKIKILCLGDSFTFGVGGDKRYSYPEQLEIILNKDAGDSKFIVYNGGIPGYNSSQLLRHFEEFLQKFNPDIVVIMVGTNNRGIPLESNYFLFSNKGIKNQIYKLDYFLSKLRSYKLLKFAVGKLKKNILPANKNANEENFVAKNDARANSAEFDKFIKLGNAYFDKREATLAKEAFQNAIALNPDDERGHLGLARVFIHCFGKDALAIEELDKALQINPYNRNPDIFDSLWMANYRLGRNKEAREAILKYVSINTLDYEEGMHLSHLLTRGLPDVKNEESFNKLLRFDLENIVKLGRKNNVKIILQNYHLSKENRIIRYVAESLKVPLVDNESVFEKLILYNEREINWKNNKEYFAEDGHCNANGYRIMAENVYEVIRPEVGKLR